MKPSDAQVLLQDFYRDKLALRQHHEAAAKRVSSYVPNNAYQYVISREDVQLTWLRSAIEELRGSVPDGASVSESDHASERAIFEDDVQRAGAFVNHWRGPVEAMTNARQRMMLRVILGETLEHKRFFEQAIAGRPDLLGRSPEAAGTGGGVLSSRWLE